MKYQNKVDLNVFPSQTCDVKVQTIVVEDDPRLYSCQVNRKCCCQDEFKLDPWCATYHDIAMFTSFP